MTDFDVLITGGFVVDGTGCPGSYTDVGIIGDTIAKIGDLGRYSAAKTIDATGKTVAPGFVVQHAHYDASFFWDPYCLDAGRNGVTTVVNANCGFGFAPVRKKDKERIMGMMETTEQIPISHQKAAMPWDWETFPDFMDRTRCLPKGINVATYLPLNPVLVYVMGIEAAKTRDPNPEEMRQIHRLINEAMDAGAIGISMSVMGAEGNTHVDIDGTSMPTDSMSDDAILEICKTVFDRGEGIVQMLPQIAHYGKRSVTRRAAEMAKGSGARIIHNTFLTHDLAPQMVDQDLEWLNAMRAEGLDVTAGALVNRGWVEAGIKELDAASGSLPAVRRIVACKSDEEILTLIQEPEFITQFVNDYSSAPQSNGAAGLEGQTVVSVGDKAQLRKYVGRKLGEIADEEGRHAIEVMLDLGAQSNLDLQLKSPPITATEPDQALKLMANPCVTPGGSDGGAHTKAFGMGHYATDLLIWMVRETNNLTIEEMHFQLSLKHARAVNIRNRGALLPGYKADILVYDLNKLHFDMTNYEIVHDMPNGDWRRQARAGGYDMILVNGVITHNDDEPNGATPGEFVSVTTDFREFQKVAAE